MGFDDIIDELRFKIDSIPYLKNELFIECDSELEKLSQLYNSLQARYDKLQNKHTKKCEELTKDSIDQYIELCNRYGETCEQYSNLLSECGIYPIDDDYWYDYSLPLIEKTESQIDENALRYIEENKINKDNIVTIGTRLYDKTGFLEGYINKADFEEIRENLEEIREQHEEELEDIREQHEEELEDIREQHEEELEDIREQHEEQIEEIREQYDNFLDKYGIYTLCGVDCKEDTSTLVINGIKYQIDKNALKRIKYRRINTDNLVVIGKQLYDISSFSEEYVYIDDVEEICDQYNDLLDDLRYEYDINIDSPYDINCRGHSRLTVTNNRIVKSDQNEKGKIIEHRIKTSDYVTINVNQRSPQWHELRVGKVTGTTAYYLKNHSVDYAIRKGYEKDAKDYTNEHMKRGRELESIGIAKFAEQKGVIVESVGFVNSLVHNAAGFSPDGVVYDNDGNIKTIIEHKAFNEKHHFACAEQVDNEVMYQIQFGIFVTGAQDAYLVLFNPDVYPRNKQLIIKHIQRNSGIQKLFEEKFKEYESKRLSS